MTLLSTDREHIDECFEALIPLLEAQNKGDGFTRESYGDYLPECWENRHDLDASEFMLMQSQHSCLGFKHRDTRNYIYLRRSIPGDPWKLHIPATGRPFHRGTF